MNVKYWVIRHKPTGYMMPSSGCGRRGGYTHDEPMNPKHIAPRMFGGPGPAKCALTCWLQGRHSNDYDGGYNVSKVANRNKDDMEVVEVQLCLP